MPNPLIAFALLGGLCAPVFAQTAGLRAPLQAWITNQRSPSQYEDWFVPFRKALLLAKSTKCALVPNGGTDARLYDLVPVLGPLDRAMESFAAESAGALPAKSLENLLNLAAAFRANGDSLEPLLPWLLLLQKRSAPDARVEVCLFEAWGADALDCAASKAAAARLAKLDEAPLREFLFEVKQFPDGKPGTVQRLVSQLCAGKIAKGERLGAFALRGAFVAEIENDYELAMQLGDFAAASKCLERMLVANPDDWAPQLMIELTGGRTNSGTRFVDRYRDASPDERTAIDARLRGLGFAIVAPGQTVAAVAQVSRDGTLEFFRNDGGDRTKKLDATLKTAEKAYTAKLDAAKDLRDDVAELERKIKKNEHIVGMRREVRDWRQRIEDKNAEAAKLDAEASKELEAKTRIETERQNLLDQIEAVKKRRGEFRLQRDGAGPEAARETAAGEPPAATPLPSPASPAGPAPDAPAGDAFDLALPQAKELRDATADLDAGQLERARTTLIAVKAALARAPADATTKRMVAVTSHRLGECLHRLGMQKAKVARNDATVEQDYFLRADGEFARVTGADFATAREGSSLNAAALRWRIQINSTLYAGYRALATAQPTMLPYRTKRDAYGAAANRLFQELQNSYATSTLPDGRRIVDVAREEAAALGR
jgi:hypothetical protein